MGYLIKYYCLTDKGHVRRNNQDNFVCNNSFKNIDDQNGHAEGMVKNGSNAVFAVFDGLGGEEKGEKAAEIAAETLIDFDSKNNPVKTLLDYCTEANKAIADYAEMYDAAMGTTAAIILFDQSDIFICNVGDTKIFKYSKGKLSQISKDHVMPGSVGGKAYLSQNLGMPEDTLELEPYIAKGSYIPHDRFLICSDGLTNMVPEKVIETILEKNTLKDATDKLMAAALDHGGIDNITILICEIHKERENWLSKLISSGRV